MKKKMMAGLLVAAFGVVGFSGTSLADETSTIDGRDNGKDTADITINGNLAADNTDPDSGLPEGDPVWVNVTVPTVTSFWNTPTQAAFQSPNYTITNNSGRPVTLATTAFKQNDSVTLPNDFSLNAVLNGTDIKLAEAGSLAFSANDNLMTLANKDGKMTSAASAVTDSNKASYKYTGSATVSSSLKPQFQLTMKFTPVVWN
ncbi:MULTISPECIES: hypothetical protein [Enterococcus]|uniref:WxL domain-containing protein n=1 Tax=Enterococcus alishanensis TaxID=1303817 RepID=A0ABS6THY4_9ENTE|nr:hypothetical protein [Enterococcus alishanensis]MBV7392553.1 hypothetical protein [Enterococcus alishanensis]